MKIPKDLEVSLYKDFADESNYLASLIGAQAVLEHEMIKKLEEASEVSIDLVDVLENDPDISDITQLTNKIYDLRQALAEFRAWKDGKSCQ